MRYEELRMLGGLGGLGPTIDTRHTTPSMSLCFLVSCSMCSKRKSRTSLKFQMHRRLTSDASILGAQVTPAQTRRSVLVTVRFFVCCNPDALFC